MKDPRKLCNQIAGTTRVCFGERFIVTMTLALNGNENAWEYPAFSMLPDCTATQCDLQLSPTSRDYDQISIADKAMINIDNSNFLQFLCRNCNGNGATSYSYFFLINELITPLYFLLITVTVT